MVRTRRQEQLLQQQHMGPVEPEGAPASPEQPAVPEEGQATQDDDPSTPQPKHPTAANGSAAAAAEPVDAAHADPVAATTGGAEKDGMADPAAADAVAVAAKIEAARAVEGASPAEATIAAVPPPPPPPRVLKSALKAPRRASEVGASGGEGGDGEELTPANAGVKKRVRIHSSSNMVHVFQRSVSPRAGEDGWEEANGGGSGVQRRWRGGSRLYGAFAASEGEGGEELELLEQEQAARLLRQQLRRQRRERRASAGREGLPAWAGPVATLAWMITSSLLIFANKRLMVDHGFRFPFALTALGQAVSVLLGWLSTLLGLAELRPPPSMHVAVGRMLPVAATFAVSLWLGNFAYLGLSVAFINILKAVTPAVTLVTGVALGLEALSPATLAATGLIAGGTVLATLQELGKQHFCWVSFSAFAFSIVFEALRVVLLERLLGGLRYNAMEALVYSGPLTFVCLLAGAFTVEWEELTTVGWQIMQQRPWEFMHAAVLSFLLNLACYYAIQATSSTTFKVAGCLKNVVVVWGGILQGDVVTRRELQGYAISLLGFFVYSAARWSGGQAKAVKATAVPSKRQN